MTYLKAPFEQDNPRGYHFQVWKKEATPPDRQFLIRGFETSLSPSNFSKILNFGKVKFGDLQNERVLNTKNDYKSSP